MRRRKSRSKGMSAVNGQDFVEEKLIQYILALVREVELETGLIDLATSLLNLTKRQRAAEVLRDWEREYRLQERSLERLSRRPDHHDLARVIEGVLEEHPEFENAIRRLLAESVELASQGNHGKAYKREEPKGAAKRLAQLQKELSLSEDELRLLELSYVITNHRDFERYLDNYENMEGRLHLVSLMTGLTPGKIKKLYHSRSKVIALGLMDKDGRHGDLPPYSLEDAINEYLLGLGEKDLFTEFVRQDKGRAYSLASFPQDNENKQMVQKILQNPPSKGANHVLFYGTPGTGKTEFVRAAAKSLGLKLYWVKRRDSDRPRRNFLNNVLLALKLLEQDERALVAVDEADELLNTRPFLFFSSSVEKGEINDVMDGASGRLVWITNGIGRMDSSTKRRFVYSMHFKPFSAKARKKIWGKLLRRHPLKPYIQGDFLDKITARFQVDLSAMSGFLHKTWDMVQNDLSSSAKDSVAPEDVRLVQDTLLALLTEQERLKKNGAQVPKLQEQQAVELYDPEVLVTDHDPQEIRNVAQRFLSMSDEQKNPLICAI